ncbi:sensor histidine kinase [Mesorhizobium sp. CGMCC 1.15528]|uniref:histidine kinase n=1 Tax=Mesorhizobium zhangyense TaxID=1776730 RepID=A0A7C9VHI7_9HYPH|nr:sensor histidine kinase [Mesorhizobium zhangyense]
MHNSRMVISASVPSSIAGAGPSASGRRAWWVFGAVAAAVIAATLWIAGEVASSRAIVALEAQGRTDANLNAALLRAVLEKQRALPLVLSQDSELQAALATKDASAFNRLSQKLEGLAAGTQSAVIYVIGLDGIAVSASNWREPTSFVGNDYQFREYFQRAMTEGNAEHFALGTVSKRPGLYISRRVDGASGQLGVVVVKLEFDQVEADWNATGRVSYVVDRRGIVLITSLPSWRFMTVGEIAADKLVAIRESLQFGDAPLRPLPFEAGAAVGEDAALAGVILPGNVGRTEFLEVRTPVPTTPWELRTLMPIKPQVPVAVRAARTAALLGAVSLLAFAGFLLNRRRRAAARIAEAQRARDELERRVTERTQDLSLARDRLQVEISDHRKTEATLQTVQQDLVQANRLAILGQVAAGVAHEINQPVATIRAYADNARTFLARGQRQSAEENLNDIAALTDRIGTITGDLKALSRKGRGSAEPVVLKQVIEGALMLLRSRFAGRMDALDIALPPEKLRVMGNPIRLEQVLINLFQNALEAVGPEDGGRVEVRAIETGDTVTLTVADNGPGIPEKIREGLFTPFNTSKENGLGLGLVIAKDIVSDYGGRIEVESDAGGTRFSVHLRKA